MKLKYPRCKIVHNVFKGSGWPYTLYYKKSFFSFWKVIEHGTIADGLEELALRLVNSEYPKTIYKKEKKIVILNDRLNPRLTYTVKEE
jgi:hypothetical protein